jgi:flagellar operon protein
VIDAIRFDSAAAVQPSRPAGITPKSGGNFAGELVNAELKFSAHAQKRLQDRNIQLSEADRARISESADLAAAKGAREALLVMDRLALVVGVPTRTVITVMEPQAGDPAVFTNIDSVVMVPKAGA